MEISHVEATAIEVTRTFTSLTYDGELPSGWRTTYSEAWNQLEANKINDWPTGVILGQIFAGTKFQIYKTYVYFDTSIIPTDVNVTSAKLSLYIHSNLSVTDFNITIQNGQPTYPHISLELGDYYKGYYSGNGGQMNTSTIAVNAYNNISLNAEGINWLNLQEITKLCLRSDRDINGQQPSGEERIAYKCAEAGEDYTPKLYVTYETEGYNYIVHGPYFEDGSVATKIVNLTLQIENLPSESYSLNGTDGVVDTLDIQIEQQGIAFTWNFSAYTNYTRTFCLTSDTFEEIWIFIPDIAEESVALYTFTVTDFVGVTNACLETVINVAGQNRIVERQSLEVISDVPFWMVWANRYDIRLVCDEGTYTWGGFIALSEQSQSLVISTGMFPISVPWLNVTVIAKRMNATWIETNYTDNELLTSWVSIAIKYKEAYTWNTAYFYNETGNTHKLDWYSADNETDYAVTVTAYRDGETKTWTFSCAKPPVTDNPWKDIFESLGVWPIPAETVLGLCLTLGIFGVFSYRNIGAGCVSGVMMAGFFTAIGWLNLSWSLIALAMALAILVAIQEAKKVEREI